MPRRLFLIKLKDEVTKLEDDKGRLLHRNGDIEADFKAKEADLNK